MISKIDLRKKLLEKRKSLDIEKLSGLICEKIKSQEVFIQAKNIFAYYPKPYEVDITSLFKEEDKIWFLPKTFKEKMFFYEYKNGDELKKGSFGVFEPKNNEKTNIIPDLIIVPALSVDKNNYRLGYGKGFYDRFLGDFGEMPPTLCPVFSKLILEKIPTEEHDRRVDIVITE